MDTREKFGICTQCKDPKPILQKRTICRGCRNINQQKIKFVRAEKKRQIDRKKMIDIDGEWRFLYQKQMGQP